MIPDQVLEQIRGAADIVAIVGEHVPLKRAGNSFRGPCPFHNGKDSNFSVQAGRGYNCFVCGEKGDVIAFVQRQLGLDFIGAVRHVAGRCGIQVPDEQERSGPDPRTPFWEINAAAVEYFTKQLDAHPPTIGYLASRNLTLEEARRFGLGYAPTNGGIRTHLHALGFDDARQVAAGLSKETEKGKPPLFRDRLMFPIGDASGKPVGFGGRALGDFQPKYLNTAESPVFSKGKLLYGYYRAKSAARRNGRVLVVEGFLDTIRVVLSGIEEVVAPLGTALTPDQAELIRRVTETCYLIYDGDGPGLKATFRAGDVLLAQGLAPRVVTLPDKTDPDSFVRDHGRAALEQLVTDSIDILDRKIQLIEKVGLLISTVGKREALEKLLPTIRAAADPVTRDLYLARAADLLGVKRSTIERSVTAKPRFGKVVSAQIVGAPPLRGTS